MTNPAGSETSDPFTSRTARTSRVFTKVQNRLFTTYFLHAGSFGQPSIPPPCVSLPPVAFPAASPCRPTPLCQPLSASTLAAPSNPAARAASNETTAAPASSNAAPAPATRHPPRLPALCAASGSVGRTLAGNVSPSGASGCPISRCWAFQILWEEGKGSGHPPTTLFSESVSQVCNCRGLLQNCVCTGIGVILQHFGIYL